MATLARSAFGLHLVVETVAGLNFLMRPSATLLVPQPHSHGVIRQYGVLLLATNLMAYGAWSRPTDALSSYIAAGLACYHLGPLIRAASKIMQSEEAIALGGPGVHVGVHLLCGALLLAACLW